MKINDRLKPFGIDDSINLKAFKGHCKLELTNVKTGKKECQEHDNMVTKGLEYLVANGGMTNPTIFNAGRDLFTNLIGGVLLLDTALDEDDEIVTVPSGVTMTGNGALGVLNTAAPTEFGSYNELESGWQQDGAFKMVWDWTTSQANGNISCVGLTSYYGGYCGIGNKQSQTSKGGNQSINVFNSVYSKNTGYYLGTWNNRAYILTTANRVTEWEVKEYLMAMDEYDIRDSQNLFQTNTYTVAIPDSIKNLTETWFDGGTTPIQFQRSFQKGNISYIVLGARRWSSSYNYCRVPYYIVKYNLETRTVLDVLVIDSSFNLGQTLTGFGINDKWFIWGTGIAIEMANLANVIDFGVGASDPYATADDIFWDGSRRFDLGAETAYPINANGNLGNWGYKINDILYFDGGAIRRDPRYLATIFNLDSPVVKTADKTMKVTYVLRFS